MHSITKCHGCGIVMSQCRCPAKDKDVIWSECAKCNTNELYGVRRENAYPPVQRITREEAAERYPERQEYESESAPLTTIIEAIADVADAFDSSDVDTGSSFEPGGGDGGGGGASGEW